MNVCGFWTDVKVLLTDTMFEAGNSPGDNSIRKDMITFIETKCTNGYFLQQRCI